MSSSPLKGSYPVLLLVLSAIPGLALVAAVLAVTTWLRDTPLGPRLGAVLSVVVALLLPALLAIPITQKMILPLRIIVLQLISTLVHASMIVLAFQVGNITLEHILDGAQEVLTLARGAKPKTPEAVAATGVDGGAPQAVVAKPVAPAPPDEEPAFKHVPGTLYQWLDKDGTLFITDTPPPKGGQMLSHTEPSKPAPAPTPTSSPERPAIPPTSFTRNIKAGDVAPNISGINGRGETVRLSDLKGKPVWLAFSGQHCRFCMEEAKSMAELQKSLGDGATFVTPLFVDPPTAKDAQEWADRFGLDAARVIAVDGSAFPPGGVPWNVLLDREGKVSDVMRGRVEQPVMEQRVRALM